jgi:hypothetical protein
MNIEEIKQQIEMTAAVYDDDFVAWNVVADSDCVREAFELLHKTWPQATIKTFIADGHHVVQALFRDAKTARYDGIHLRVYEQEHDAVELMQNAGIQSVLTLPHPGHAQVWFIDCVNVPDPLPEWAERLHFSEDSFKKHLAQ